MKHYTAAHAVFFEAALSGWPTVLLEFLAEDLPTLEDMVPHKNGMLIKDSIEWKTLVNKAQAEELPDYCVYCDTCFGYIPGGQLREGCPNCIENFPADADSNLTPLLRMGWTLATVTDNKYFPELIEYLYCCHLHWVSQVEWKPEVLYKRELTLESRKSLLDKLK